MTYKPTPRIAEIMTWCLEQVNAVPYNVTLRWIFYQAYQHFHFQKNDYGNFKGWTSKVRKEFWNGWKPDTLVDDGREILYHGSGKLDIMEWYISLLDEECTLDKRVAQDKIIIICFEAAAMTSQFEHYTKDYYVTLAPFRGDASIEYKWRIAKWIEQLDVRYDKPIKILYFGDLDPKGQEIPENALRDVRKWCKIPFEYEHIGLLQEHVDMWNLPENPEKHGFQWEALDDDMARQLIQDALNQEIDLDKIIEVKDREGQAEYYFQQRIQKIIDRMEEDGEDYEDEE